LILIMNRTHGSSTLSRKLVVACGLILALAALTAPGAEGAGLVTPHSATHTVSPQAAGPQPSGPSLGPGTSSPAPSPSSSDQQGGDGQGTSTSLAATSEPESYGPYDDVGHNAGQAVDTESAGPSSMAILESAASSLQDIVGPMQAQMTSGLAEYPIATAFMVAHINEALAQLGAKLVQLYQQEQQGKPEVAVREALGYTGVSDQACGGGNYETINGDLEDPNNGIAFC
jgi:hypothetical protein